MTTEPLAGRVAVLTGGSKGLGVEFARSLVAAGAKVALLARPSPELDAVAAELGDAVAAIPCDVSDPAMVRAAMAAAHLKFGRIDILINNAALLHLNWISQATDADIQREVGVNLLGPLYCMREAMPHLRQSGHGHIINVSSLAIRIFAPYMSLYSATKAGLETLSSAMRAELKAEGIRLTVLRLGAVKTGEGLARYWEPQKKAAYLEAAREAGVMKQTGKWMSPLSVAHTLLAILSTAEDVSPEIVELAGR
ncbi:MAG TPA: SDR family oxidoreductase [Rhizomicrobium sp.]|nr:SDR family oxidoreductase [Rhizomicrobium sp.]